MSVNESEAEMEHIAQVETFIGYERTLHDAVKAAQNQANVWMAHNRLTIDRVSVAAQTIAESVPTYDQVFYVHVITVMYGRTS